MSRIRLHVRCTSSYQNEMLGQKWFVGTQWTCFNFNCNNSLVNLTYSSAGFYRQCLPSLVYRSINFQNCWTVQQCQLCRVYSTLKCYNSQHLNVWKLRHFIIFYNVQLMNCLHCIRCVYAVVYGKKDTVDDVNRNSSYGNLPNGKSVGSDRRKASCTQNEWGHRLTLTYFRDGLMALRSLILNLIGLNSMWRYTNYECGRCWYRWITVVTWTRFCSKYFIFIEIVYRIILVWHFD